MNKFSSFKIHRHVYSHCLKKYPGLIVDKKLVSGSGKTWVGNTHFAQRCHL